MRRGFVAPVLVVLFSVVAGGWLLQEGVARSENLYVELRVLREVIDRVRTSFVEEIPESALYESAIDGVIQRLDDPHSSFLPATDFEDLRIRTEGEYGGVGLEVTDRDGFVTVVAPIPGSPGARAGIRAGDRFFRIDGVAADTMVTEQAVQLLRGRPGTEITVEMLRPGVEEPIGFTLERAVIELRAVPFATMLEDGVGYVPFQTVRESSTREVTAAIDSLRGEGLRALVFDLRGNPGGLLDEGIGVADLFLRGGDAIVETRGRASDQNETYGATSPDRYPGLPIVVLVDGASASASEIVAGALQDHDRATVIGETTYGKGSVQSLYRLAGGNVLRLTTARWYTPLGRSIHLEPDLEVQIDTLALTISGHFVQPPGIEGRPVYRTESGRTLYGGGGITPDLFVTPEMLSPEESESARALLMAGGRLFEAFFAFGVGYVQEHPALEPGFVLSEGDLGRFYDTLGLFGVEVDRTTFDGARRLVRYHLEQEIAQQAWGDLGQFQQARRYDRQLQRAMEILQEVRTPEDLLTTIERAEPDVASSF